MHKIFNKNTLKVSYNGCKNISSTISSHNRRIIKPPNNEYGCNRTNRNSCPLDNKFLKPKVKYQADVSAPTTVEKTYFGLSATAFKERYRNHSVILTSKVWGKHWVVRVYLEAKRRRLYVLIKSPTRFRVNPHSIVTWMSRSSLLETGVISEV